MAKTSLSLWGKINVIKMNTTSRLMYILQDILMLIIHIRYFTQINKLMRFFLWQAKLSLPYGKGSFSLPDF